MKVTIDIKDDVFTNLKELKHVMATIDKLQTEIKCSELKKELEETRLHFGAIWYDLTIEMCHDFQSQVEALFQK